MRHDDTDEPLRRNAVLAALPPGEYDQVRAKVTIMEPEIRQQVYDPGGPIGDVYFPLGAVFSMVAVADGRGVEVATVGLESMVGLPFFLGAASSPHSSFCQIPGPAARMSATDFRSVLTHDGVLHGQLNRCVQATMVQIAQNVVCNNTHPAEQRAARWLATTQDRTLGPTFPLTQEFLAQMLGVRRPTVSEIAGNLQSRKLIEYRRGVVRIVDREQLIAASCACYQIVRAEFDAIMDPDVA